MLVFMLLALCQQPLVMLRQACAVRMHCVAECCSECCSVLQCVAVGCSVLQTHHSGHDAALGVCSQNAEYMSTRICVLIECA